MGAFAPWAAAIAGIFLLFLLVRIFTFPIKLIVKLVINTAIGLVLLLLCNGLGSYIGLSIPITPLNAIIAGVLGLPGTLLLAIYYLVV